MATDKAGHLHCTRLKERKYFYVVKFCHFRGVEMFSLKTKKLLQRCRKNKNETKIIYSICNSRLWLTEAQKFMHLTVFD